MAISSVESSLATRSESASSRAMARRAGSASAAPQRGARTNSPARLTQGELGRTQICAQLTLDFLFSRKDPREQTTCPHTPLHVQLRRR